MYSKVGHGPIIALLKLQYFIQDLDRLTLYCSIHGKERLELYICVCQSAYTGQRSEVMTCKTPPCVKVIPGVLCTHSEDEAKDEAEDEDEDAECAM